MSHARLIPPPVKAFQAPYNHLRYRYPETWKRLVEMQEIRDPCPEGLHMKTRLGRVESQEFGVERLGWLFLFFFCPLVSWLVFQRESRWEPTTVTNPLRQYPGLFLSFHGEP
ncbi:unnamed protein product [Effrenium voratum]|nr:unnamed protein product [Effrenium voratum]